VAGKPLMRLTFASWSIALKAGVALVAIGDAALAQAQDGPTKAATLTLSPCRLPALDGDGKCGTYWVFEDRARRAGRRIPLNVIVLPARNGHPLPDPMFLVSPGGPGTTNSETGLAIGWSSWWRDDRDVVIVDLRGTSGSNRLDCNMPGSDDHPVGYLSTLFPRDAIVRCRDELSKVADLTKYTTPLIIDDLDEVRTALGYQKINLWGGSWGTRAVLFYLKLRPRSIRSAIVEGVAPPSLKNPLPHARAAQNGLDSLFAACARQADCHEAFPNLQGDLATTMRRLHEQPATVIVPNGERADTTRLSWQQFAEALRVTTYYVPPLLAVPRLVHHAADGDLTPFAVAGIAANRGLRTILRVGFLLSITCSEDVSRIGESEIGPATDGTYLGDSRVREQMAACRLWPHASLPAGYGDPIRSKVPVFLLSGEWDPVSTAADGVAAARYLPNGIHVIAPGAHVPSGPCVVSMERAFLAAASAKTVDRSCVATMSVPPFVVDTVRP